VNHPEKIANTEQLEELLSEPTPACVEAIKRIKGDILILGVAGKMGPTLARMLVRAALAADGSPRSRKIIGVSRFSNPSEESKLKQHGIETIKADLLDPDQLKRVPEAPNVIYMAARKFGSTGDEPFTWAMNAVLPGMVAQRFGKSRIAAFSTGNVYPLAPVLGGGSRETDPVGPIGEYAMSCLGRERAFQFYCKKNQTPVSLIPLNYACELRYGVLVDMARKVFEQQEIDLSMGAFNAIWQGDANAMAIASLSDAAAPAFVLNVAGPEILSIRGVCEKYGAMFNKTPRFIGTEKTDALISNGQLGHRLYGYPSVPVEQLMLWIADWVARGGETINKPTHFETRDGKY
jgi:nucleoside-diphosphate-sugar epimerase